MERYVTVNFTGGNECNPAFLGGSGGSGRKEIALSLQVVGAQRSFRGARAASEKGCIWLPILVVPKSFTFDLFVSYYREDDHEDKVSEIVARVQNEYRDFTGGRELRVYFDTSQLVGIGSWRQSTLEALGSSRLLLVCLSPNYLLSEYCSWELNQYLRQRAAHARVLQSIEPIYFIEVLGGNDKDFEQRAAKWVAELQLRECCPGVKKVLQI